MTATSEASKSRLTRGCLLALAGAALIAGGFFYDVVMAGIPYPDPTPAMRKRYEFHQQVATSLQAAGGLLLLLGVVALPRLRRIVGTARD